MAQHAACTMGHAETECAARLVGPSAYPRDDRKSAPTLKYGPGQPAAGNLLPPREPPGVKGRRLRGVLGKALDILVAKKEAGIAEVLEILKDAQSKYVANET
jgi:hypothetical protein